MQTTTTTKQKRYGTARASFIAPPAITPDADLPSICASRPEKVGLLERYRLPCPRCRRHGGSLKPQGRIGDKLFAAKLMFRSWASTPVTRRRGPLSDMQAELSSRLRDRLH